MLSSALSGNSCSTWWIKPSFIPDAMDRRRAESLKRKGQKLSMCGSDPQEQRVPVCRYKYRSGLRQLSGAVGRAQPWPQSGRHWPWWRLRHACYSTSQRLTAEFSNKFIASHLDGNVCCCWLRVADRNKRHRCTSLHPHCSSDFSLVTRAHFLLRISSKLIVTLKRNHQSSAWT